VEGRGGVRCLQRARRPPLPPVQTPAQQRASTAFGKVRVCASHNGSGQAAGALSHGPGGARVQGRSEALWPPRQRAEREKGRGRAASGVPDGQLQPSRGQGEAPSRGGRAAGGHSDIWRARRRGIRQTEPALRTKRAESAGRATREGGTGQRGAQRRMLRHPLRALVCRPPTPSRPPLAPTVLQLPIDALPAPRRARAAMGAQPALVPQSGEASPPQRVAENARCRAAQWVAGAGGTDASQCSAAAAWVQRLHPRSKRCARWLPVSRPQPSALPIAPPANPAPGPSRCKAESKTSVRVTCVYARGQRVMGNRGGLSPSRKRDVSGEAARAAAATTPLQRDHQL
jgi:hypothetical protein